MSQTTGTGAKKIQDTDNWRDIFDIHNDTVDAYDGKIGTTALPTTAQTLTGAVAEHETDITGVNNKIGSTTLPTTAQTLTGAIDEHESDISALNSNLANITAMTNIASSLTANKVAINNAFKQEIGKLVICYLYLTTTAAISADDDVISGLPGPHGTQNYTSTFLASDAAVSNTNTYRMAIMDGAKVRALESIPNGIIIRATFMYFKA